MSSSGSSSSSSNGVSLSRIVPELYPWVINSASWLFPEFPIPELPVVYPPTPTSESHHGESKEEKSESKEEEYEDESKIEISEEIFADRQIMKELSCSICMNIIDDPVALDNSRQFVVQGVQILEEQCGHVFCRKCITTSLGIKLECPLCKRKSSEPVLISDVNMRRRIKNMKMICCYKEYGCIWDGQYADVRAHIRKCRYRGDKCGMCSRIIKRDNEVKHECPMEMIQCTLDDKCCAMVKRCNIAQHYKVCDYRIVKCSMLDVGCMWTGMAINLSSHISDKAGDHMALLRSDLHSSNQLIITMSNELRKCRDEGEMEARKWKEAAEMETKKYKELKVSFEDFKEESKAVTEKAVNSCKRKICSEQNRTSIRVPWTNGYFKGENIILNGFSFIFEIDDRSIYLTCKTRCKRDVYISLCKKESIPSNVLIEETWFWKNPFERSGFERILTIENINNAVDSGYVTFNIIVSGCDDMWDVRNVKKHRTSMKRAKICVVKKKRVRSRRSENSEDENSEDERPLVHRLQT